MEIMGRAQHVRIYIGESDRWQGKPLHAAILEYLRREDCAGATVTRALAGFGAHSRIHTASIVALSGDLPLVIDWVDNPQRVARVMPGLRAMVSEGLITVQDVQVITYSHRQLRAFPAAAPVHDIMTREVQTIQPDTPLATAVALLLDKVYRALPVIDDERRVVGIITAGDLLKHMRLPAITTQTKLAREEVIGALQRMRAADQRVADVMTPDPVTIQPQNTVSQAVQIMVERDVKRLPVVDEAGRLLGMVSRVNVLRALAEPPVGESKQMALPAGPVHSVADIMMRSVPTVTANASLAEVVEDLVRYERRRVVVVDEQRHVVGLITDGDLIARATQFERPGIVQTIMERVPLASAESRSLQKRTAADVMSQPVITVSAGSSLLDALQLLLQHNIKRLPVVDDEGRLVGLVGRAGVLRGLALA